MDATPTKLGEAFAVTAGSQEQERAAGPAWDREALEAKWAAVHEAAAAAAAIAGVRPDEPGSIAALPDDADPNRRVWVEQGIADLSAILEPGLAALLSAHAHGVRAEGAALALWREFLTARDAMLARDGRSARGAEGGRPHL